MNVRGLVILAVAALAIGPASFLIFGSESRAPARASALPTTAKPTVTATRGCVERAYREPPLSPFAPHPPLPRPGFYAPGKAPAQAAMMHALVHGYVIVRYRPDVEAAVRRDLRGALRHAASPVVVAAAEGMPFAAGAVVQGRSTTCAELTDQLATWVRGARAQR